MSHRASLAVAAVAAVLVVALVWSLAARRDGDVRPTASSGESNAAADRSAEDRVARETPHADGNVAPLPAASPPPSALVADAQGRASSPSNAGPRVTGTLLLSRAGGPFEEIEAILLDLEGERVVDATRVRAAIVAGGAAPRGAFWVSLDGGRFALDVAPRAATERRELRVRATSRSRIEENAWLELPRALDRDLEVGAVELAPLPVLVRGRVTDPHDEPVDGAGIIAQVVADDPARELLRHPLDERARTDAGGAFAIRGRTNAASLRLTFTHALRNAEWRSIDLPSERELHVVMRLKEMASVTSTIRGLEPRAQDELRGRLLRDDEDERRRDRVRFTNREGVRVGGDGTVRFVHVEAGHYELQLYLEPSGEVVHRVPDLDVRDGTKCADPRLQVDLGDALHVHELELRRADGRPAAGILVRVRLDSKHVARLRSDGEGRCSWLSANPTPSAEVFASDDGGIPWRPGVPVVLE